MSAQRIHIEPQILRWIIERRGLDVDDYCLRNDKFAKWLNGEQDPTFRQAEEFAKSNYVPMGYLYLNEPLIETMPIPFFRSTKKKVENLNVMDTVKILAERQLWLSNYLRSENLGNLDFVGSIATNMNVGLVASKMHEILDLPMDWAFSLPTVDKAIKELTDRLEDVGCIVAFSSTVGFSNARSIDVNDCRGFCLVDKDAPFIFVNSKDAKQAQLFTLAHEFAHILLGYSAGMGSNEGMQLGAKEDYCDKLAAVFLAPADLFIGMWRKTSGNIEALVRKFKISRFVVARRAKELGLLEEDSYWNMINTWKSEPIVETIRKTGPVPFSIRAVRNNGRVFLVHVNNAVNGQKLLHREAYRLTGMKGETFHSVVKSNYFLGV
jgi:Zn-dependent peptidase ImmA (M78 family)